MRAEQRVDLLTAGARPSEDRPGHLVQLLVEALQLDRPLLVLVGAVHDHHRRHLAARQRPEEGHNVGGEGGVVAAEGLVIVARQVAAVQLVLQVEAVDDQGAVLQTVRHQEAVLVGVRLKAANSHLGRRVWRERGLERSGKGLKSSSTSEQFCQQNELKEIR